MAPEPTYCVVCGQENPGDAERCMACGSRIDAAVTPDAPTVGQPLRWRWVGLFVGGMSLLLLAVSFLPLVRLLFLPLRFPGPLEALTTLSPAFRPPIVVEGGPITLVPLFGLYVVGGIVLGAVARTRIYREMAVAGLVMALVQWTIWALLAKGQVTLLFTSPVVFSSGNTLFQMPPALFLLLVNLLCLGLGVGFARLGVWLTERITGEATCYVCEKSFSIRPKRPLACPGCGTPDVHRGVNWLWAGPAVGATVVVFFVVVRLLGPPLGFYWRCDFNQLSPSCREGVQAFNAEAYSGDSEMYAWKERPIQPGDPYPGVILHAWKYVLYTAPLFLFPALVVAWGCRRSRLRTAAVTILLSWVGASATALLALGFGQFEGAFIVSLRLHLLAALPWALVSGVGLAIGRKLSRDTGLDLDALDEDEDGPSARRRPTLRRSTL
jgi:hypothetical protein